MAEQQLSPEQQKILTLFEQYKESSSSDSNKKKVIRALQGSRKLLDEAIKLLEGSEDTSVKDTAPDADAEAPYGRKKDGTPKKAPGRASTKSTPEA